MQSSLHGCKSAVGSGLTRWPMNRCLCLDFWPLFWLLFRTYWTKLAFIITSVCKENHLLIPRFFLDGMFQSILALAGPFVLVGEALNHF